MAKHKSVHKKSVRSSEMFRLVVTNTPVVSFALDQDGVFILSEGLGLAKLGLKPGEVVGQSAFDVYRDHPQICESIRQVMKQGRVIRDDIRLGEITFDAVFSPVFDKDRRVRGVIGVATDISERKQAEEQLRASESSYRGLFNSVTEAIYIQDREGYFLDVNEGAVKMYDYPREEFIGRLPTFLSAPGRNDMESVRKAVERAFGGEAQEFEFWGMRRNGQIFPKIVRLYKGNYFGQEAVIALAIDITEQRRAQDALNRQLKELTTLHKVAHAGIHANSVDELIQLVTREVGKAFYPDNFGVLLVEDGKQMLRPSPHYHGLTAHVPDLVPLDGCLAGGVVRSGKPKRVADVRQEKVYLEGTAGILSELCVPILIGERVIGVINAESKQLNFFTEEDERLLVTIAGQMALALEQLRLFEAERRRRQEAETLRQATAIISTSLNLRQVLENILTSLHEVVPYFSASVFLHEEDRLRIVTVRGTADQRQLVNSTFPATNSLFLRILQEKKPVILADAQTDRGFEGWGKTIHIRGWMGVPLIVRGQVTGYITLDSTEISAYSEEQAVLAQAFANQAAAAIENARLFENLQASLSELNSAYESTIEGWSLAMDLRDKETEGHTLRVTEMTLRLAHEIGINEPELIHIRRGALLHDIGKMGVPDRILLKAEGLSPQEMAEMRQHPRFAYEMLAKIPYLKPALDIPYCHHEKWDGTGYPRGLKGDEIPIAARLFALADVWDALTSDRPYRLAWSRQKTKNYILEQSGKYFDPTLVAVFMRLIEKDDET